MTTRAQILVRGIVQGVGFRPYIFSLARKRALRGQVFNNTSGVVIDIEGDDHAIELFVDEISQHPPPLSRIETVERSDNLIPAEYSDFRIVESAAAGQKFTPISPDIATCQDCLRELFDPRDRRYRYPFINCTNCGPRFTIIETIPYDRAQTTMREFKMCMACLTEYQNPLDRRFHAEPTACAACGPKLFLTDANQQKLMLESHEDPISRTRHLLSEGAIVAIKGLGGFHLACDALNADSVERLRFRKYREEKPFALMAASVDVVRQFCLVSEAEKALLHSERRPIVLLQRKPKADIPATVAPGVHTLGFMLPYTPLHYLLLDGMERPLVMTSGNVSDEPICYEDSDARRRLAEIADYFLTHNRRIHMRTDDSVTRVMSGEKVLLRRSRGYAPAPIKTTFSFQQQILGCGAELKNTFCLARDRYAFVSHHIGDLENLETLRSFAEGIEHFKRLFDLHPQAVAYDLHPEYLSTKHALAMEEISVKIGVQHHHAHIASCLADNGVEGEVIGVAMDGLGFGEDGRFWGGEFFVADFVDAERIAHLDYIPMPGGTKAIREPWRMASVYLHRALGNDFCELPLPFAEKLYQITWPTLRSMIAANTNCPETSSMGRLFDAVSALLGLRARVSYEGQAAIELETIADRNVASGYEFEVTDSGVIKTEPVIRRAVDDLLDGSPASEISAKFHLAVAQMIWALAHKVRTTRHLNRVALSGGVFQNMVLVEHASRMLTADGFEVLTHNRVPTNDGGISLGQVSVANARLSAGRF
ncbi:MAG: carbamoyltransferase HypF [Acidobacteria bacterium]|nr:carbamoyltransferase HypF [Acidobacteriota bacterium]